MRDFVVFYAWQSDTLSRHNRLLIQIALREAAERLSADAALNTTVRIDSDTQGVLGQPPVSETILKKIGACDVFAPDLTFVAKTDGGKLIPNPNVMLECGYALRAKTHSAMMGVMNTAYGPPEGLPFDMGHLRHPLKYHLETTATKAERRAVRKELSETFEEVLRPMIQAARLKEEKPFAKAAAPVPPASFFAQDEILAQFGINDSERQDFRFGSEQAIYLRLFPAFEQKQPVTRAKVKALFHARKPAPMSLTIGGLASDNSHGSIILDPKGTLTQIAGMTQGFPTGELWGLNCEPFRADTRQAFGGQSGEIRYIGMISVEKLFVRTLENYIKIATDEYKLEPPFVIEAGAVGLLGYYAVVPSVEFPSGSFEGPIRTASLQRQYALDSVSPQAIDDVLRRFFDDFYDLAGCSRSLVLTDAHVAANRHPPRTPG